MQIKYAYNATHYAQHVVSKVIIVHLVPYHHHTCFWELILQITHVYNLVVMGTMLISQMFVKFVILLFVRLVVTFQLIVHHALIYTLIYLTHFVIQYAHLVIILKLILIALKDVKFVILHVYHVMEALLVIVYFVKMLFLIIQMAPV